MVGGAASEDAAEGLGCSEEVCFVGDGLAVLGASVGVAEALSVGVFEHCPLHRELNRKLYSPKLSIRYYVFDANVQHYRHRLGRRDKLVHI